MRLKILFCLFVYFLLGSLAIAQEAKPEKKPNDLETPNQKKEMSRVKKATLYSIVPGGGQIYNKKYWKVPVIYAGFGALTYSFIFYNQVYGDVRASYIQSINGQTITNPEYANVPEEMLYTLRESYRKSRDLSAIGIAGWYVFNLVDAAVDAHLQEFDVSDKLSLKITPDYRFSYSGYSTGIKLNFRF